MRHRNQVLGVVILIIAVAIFLTATGLLDVPAFVGISTAKLVWTIILGIMFVGSIISTSWEGVIISAGVLLKMYEASFGISISIPILILIIILLIVALNMIVPTEYRNHDFVDKRANGGADIYSENDNASYVYVKTRFNGTTKYIESKNLKEVEVHAAYGGCELYLTKADAPSGELKLNLDVKGSGVDVYIPKNWKVINETKMSLSGYEEDKIVLDEGEEPPVTLRLVGKIKQSGFSISRNAQY